MRSAPPTSSSTLSIAEQIRQLEKQKQLLEKLEAEERAEQERQKRLKQQDDKIQLRAASFDGNIALVKELIGRRVTMQDGEISYPQKLDIDQSLLKPANFDNNGFNNDPINNALKGDHADILGLLVGRVADIVRGNLEDYIQYRRDLWRYHNDFRAQQDPLIIPFNTEDKNQIKKNVVNIMENDQHGKTYYHVGHEFVPHGRFSDFRVRYCTSFFNRTNSLLIEAILFGATKCAKLLVNELSADPSCYFYDTTYKKDQEITKIRGDALTLAIDCDLTDIALFLIEKGANLTVSYGNTAIKESFYSNYKYQTVWCWNGKRDLTPLLLAAKKNNVAVVKALLACGADIRDKDKNGHTAEELTTDAELKKILALPNTYRTRIERINHDPIPVSYLCEISGNIMENPIAWNGMIFCLEAFKQINIRLADDKKVGPAGNDITKAEYDLILSQPTLKKHQQHIEEFVLHQEELDRNHKSQNRLH